MTFAVWSPTLFKEDYSNSRQFIVETLLSFILQHQDKKFFIITDTKAHDFFAENTKIVILKPPPKNAFLKKIWWDLKLPAILRRIKADLFISFENRCSLTLAIPQSILIQQTEKIKPAFIKKARLVFVLSESMKNRLKEKYKIKDQKIVLINPFAARDFKEINDEEKGRIKAEHTEGKEFFLYNSHFLREEDFIELLKSFSHFKKRQQSSFKLLLLTESNSSFEKSLSSYKYRGDIKFVDTKNGVAVITAVAYAVVLPFNTNDDIVAALNSMQSGVPVIATKNSVISEMAGDAVLCAEKEVKDIGDKMMQLYKDEDFRFSLIRKGTSFAATLTREKTAEALWQSIIKGLQ